MLVRSTKCYSPSSVTDSFCSLRASADELDDEARAVLAQVNDQFQSLRTHKPGLEPDTSDFDATQAIFLAIASSFFGV